MGGQESRSRFGIARRVALAVVVVGALALALPAVGYAGAASTFGSWNGTQAIGSFGDEATATYGQVVTVPPGQSTLESFTFYPNVPTKLIFQAYVYAWNGTMATGPALYEGPDMHTTEEGVYQPITAETGGVTVTPGDQYVLFFSVSNDKAADAGSSLTGSWGAITANPYAGGNFVFLNNEYVASGWTADTWDEFTYDLAFTAVFATQQEVTAKKTAEAEAAAKKKAEAEASAKKTAELEAAVKKLTELEAKEKAEAEAKKKAEEEAKTTVVLDDSKITVQSSGKAAVELTCDGVGTCVGKVTLELNRTAGKGKHTKTQDVGGVSFSIPSGKTETLEVALNSTGRSMLKGAGGHLAGTLVILKSLPGTSKTEDESVHLSQKPKKHK